MPLSAWCSSLFATPSVTLVPSMTLTSCCLDSISSTPLLSPAQPSGSFRPPKVLSTEYPQGRPAGFSPLYATHKRLCIWHQWLVAIRDGIMVLLTQLSSLLFPLPHPFFIYLSQADLFPLIKTVCHSGWGPLISNMLSIFWCLLSNLWRLDLVPASVTKTTPPLWSAATSTLSGCYL